MTKLLFLERPIGCLVAAAAKAAGAVDIIVVICQKNVLEKAKELGCDSHIEFRKSKCC
ncbi:hypothetical protein [Enterococcus gallinarum]|uniref:hypothetical protein n=1 Tax=Enterococcus gallinarum TaxID=1353 RepID=UPI001E52EA97|nr:hypothetical protein [Enterococcus gallinarum]